jgi:hypothetical protein
MALQLAGLTATQALEAANHRTGGAVPLMTGGLAGVTTL